MISLTNTNCYYLFISSLVGLVTMLVDYDYTRCCCTRSRVFWRTVIILVTRHFTSVVCIITATSDVLVLIRRFGFPVFPGRLQSMWAGDFPLTAQAYLCDSRSPLRGLPLHAPSGLIQCFSCWSRDPVWGHRLGKVDHSWSSDTASSDRAACPDAVI